MTVRAVLREHSLDVEIRGWFDHAMCLSTDQHIPLADIEDARVVPWREARAEMGWRTGGAYWARQIATGWYSVRGRPQARQFWAVYRDRDELLLVDTTLDRPSRLVLAVPDARELAAAINERREAL